MSSHSPRRPCLPDRQADNAPLAEAPVDFGELSRATRRLVGVPSLLRRSSRFGCEGRTGPRPRLRSLAAAALLAAVAGCGAGASREPVGPARLAVSPGASSGRLRDPNDLYLAGEFGQARDAFRRLVSPGETSLEQTSVLYGLARSEYALGRVGEARWATEKLLAVLDALKERELVGDPVEIGPADPADLRAYALALLSDIALAQKRPAESVALLDRLRAEGLEGRAGGADEMLFRRAAALETAGRPGEARKAFRRLALVWPESPLVHEALTRAGNIGRPVYEARAGVFETRSSAEATARALRERGFTPRVEVETGGTGHTGGDVCRRFVVSLGRFIRREDAERAKGQAESEGFSSDVSAVSSGQRAAGRSAFGAQAGR